MSALSAGAAQTQRPRLFLLLLEPVLHLVLALVILFSATLHSSLVFDRTVVAVGLLVLTLAGWFSAGKKPHMWGIFQRINNLGAVAALLQIGHTAVGFSWIMIAWAAVTSVLKLGSFLQQKNHSGAFSDGKLATVLPVILTCCLLLSGTDQIALIGWYGAYATVWGVFGVIAAIDTAAPQNRAAQTAAATAAPAQLKN